MLLCGIPGGFPERKNVVNKRFKPADIISENVIVKFLWSNRPGLTKSQIIDNIVAHRRIVLIPNSLFIYQTEIKMKKYPNTNYEQEL